MCKKPFQSFGGKICGSCLERIDRDFIKVRDYIYDNKHANIDTVAEETEVPKNIILHLLKEGRLVIDDPGGGGVLFCEACKKPINTGRLCKECSDKVSSKIQGSIAAKKPQDQGNKGPQNTRGTAKIN
jgi:hypothetical protein